MELAEDHSIMALSRGNVPPEWWPLVQFSKTHGEIAPVDFMFMGFELGVRWYKHIETRRYLILDRDGQACMTDKHGAVHPHVDGRPAVQYVLS